jgi:two-component system, NtrC family, nitrogen regulation sensor histidine kinase NtrY
MATMSVAPPADLVADRPALPIAERSWWPVDWTRWGEPLALISVVAMAIITTIVVRGSSTEALLSPVTVALLLVGNLLPAMALLVFAGRRIVLRRAAAGEGSARLHTRLVGLFSLTAAVPTVIVAIFSSFLFQSGMDFWFSERSRGMFDSAVSVAQNFFETERRDVGANTIAMATDLRGELGRTRVESDDFYDFYVQQVVVRELTESAIIEVGPDGIARTLALIDPDSRDAANRLPPATVNRLARGEQLVTGDRDDGVEATVRLLPDRRVYLYAARGSTVLGLDSMREARAVSADYDALFARSRSLQFRFVAALYFGSLLLVGLAVWSAIIVADRVTTPIDELVGAAERVAAGDLEVRVRPVGGRPDEIATLASAFNVMTERLGEQTRDLLTATDQIESRRAFMEAVLTAVASGVLSVDRDGVVRLTNAAAREMLADGSDELTGQPIGQAVPEIAAWLADGAQDPVIDIDHAGEARTFAVRAIATDLGHVLTLEDITQQLADQRRAAWSDVARRIAHEIKNPLTPIQLAAERLQRRFGGEMGEGSETFQRLTSTIVRQVGDLRRMVDEFSSFARMPKPSFRDENVSDIVKQAVFLHDVANPDIRFTTSVPDSAVHLVCDRRLLTQAITNVVKNAVEAIGRREGEGGHVRVALESADNGVRVSVADDGVGLPEDRETIVEPYVTMREGGTGLGLAIVKKIVEEHGGTLAFGDNPGGGTLVTLNLPAQPPGAAPWPAAPLAEGTA